MRLTLYFALLLLAGGSVHAAADQQSPAEDAASPSRQKLLETGKRIYRYGIMPDGDSIQAKVRGDVMLQGSQYACTNCHRRSGIGSSEGGDQVPPIIGRSIFSPLSAGLHKQYTTLSGMHRETRPAYTRESLGRVLREGIDPAGRLLSPLMPRFVLTDDDVLAVSTYLSSLTVEVPPGITEEEIHFATITTPGTDAEAKAMLEVFNTFIRMKNAGTRNEKRRARYAPFHKEWFYESYRRWNLHVWALSGPEHSWPGQLEKYYREIPVFAVIGGVGKGQWEGVHRFCENNELPCLLPNIATPPAQADQDFYSIYFSRGIDLEALALAAVLSPGTPLSGKIIQVLRDTPTGRAAANTLRQTLASDQHPPVKDIVLDNGKRPDAAFWSALTTEHKGATWVLWLDGEELKALSQVSAEQASRIYLSATMQRDPAALQHHPLRQLLTLLSPYQPEDRAKKAQRFLAWARVRKLPISDLHIQSSAFLTATLTGESLMHLHGNFSREYFIERIEHMMESMINPSLYPRLSLAPGQRYAAKGCYVWEMGKGFETAKWIVP